MAWNIGLLLLLLVASRCEFASFDFTLVVPAGKSECFYQPVLKGMEIEFRFQVLSGGETDLNMKILDTEGYIIKHILRKTAAEYRINSTEKGDYGVCLDNSFSTFTNKRVFFELEVETENEEQEKSIENGWAELISPANIIESKLAAFTAAKENIILMMFNNIKSLRLQKQLRNRGVKDQNIADDNHWMISFWSVVNVLVMAGVFSVQVYMVRNMFEDKRRIRT